MVDILNFVSVVPTLGALTVTAVATWIVSQAIKQGPFDNRWMPLIAGGIGILLGVVVSFGWHGDIWQGLVIGLLSGVLASGGHDLITNTIDLLRK